MGVGVCIFSKGPDATSALLVDIIEPVSIVASCCPISLPTMAFDTV